MAYREVDVVEVREIVRQHLAGVATKRIAAHLGCDIKTARRYVNAAKACGLAAIAEPLGDEAIASVIAAARPTRERALGEGWRRCVEHQARIAALLGDGVRLSKVRKLLVRDGVDVTYATLRRFAQDVLGHGKPHVTLPVLDGEPGGELQVDTGWVVTLTDITGHRRRLRAFIFTANRSRYRFVYPIERETTASAIEACDAAWRFFGGVFRVLVPDNTSAIVETADALAPRINTTFLAYAQARGFVIDPARVRSPRDKGRVERAVRDVRDDCFGGEKIATVAQAREHAVRWCTSDYGERIHGTTHRQPRVCFIADELPHLLPAPTEPYDTPHQCEPKVGRDHLAQVLGALYSLPTALIGKRLTARADSRTVRFYDGAVLVKVHARQARGGRSIDWTDFPAERTAYARRDVTSLITRAHEHGVHVGKMAERLLDCPLPWTRMRRVYALLRLVRSYGHERVEAICKTALDADLDDIHRIERMLKEPMRAAQPALARVIPIGRYLRPTHQYALSFERVDEGETRE
jgi:transposase